MFRHNDSVADSFLCTGTDHETDSHMFMHFLLRSLSGVSQGPII
uniref:Uncharacterized protein n=1 Tax=Anguilla anguilla TaxID=7936 RepID=A0A0E9VDL5_ANGAN